MRSAPSLLFPPFRLDPANERLWRGTEAIVLRRKTFAMLRYLVEHAGQLVTKEELLAAVWADVVVSKGVLADSVSEVRKALGDDPEAPQFVETVYGRGYRFIAPLRSAPSRPRTPDAETERHGDTELFFSSSRRRVTVSPRQSLVGRDTELAQFHYWLNKAQGGERQIVFVSGEPGIGKTTLVDTFITQIEETGNQKSKGKGQRTDTEREGWSPRLPIAASPRHDDPSTPLIARGQCIEHYGAGEAYLPVLMALERLCRAPMGRELVSLLRQHAPTWLMQMPALLADAEVEAVQRRSLGATPERMLRELAEALEVLTVETPLVLVLEDLHWSDVSTLDLLTFLARRREPARLLVIGTYRSVEGSSPEHPLRAVTQELHLHGHCRELRLGFLSEAEIVEYLEMRFGVGAVREPSLQDMAQIVHKRTEGNPLFMVNVVDFFIAQGVIVEDNGQWTVRGERAGIETGVPDTIRQIVEKQADRLSVAEKQVLEVASIAGVEFSAAVVAAALGEDVVVIEERCKRLAQQHCFLQTVGVTEWPDGTVAAGYRFIHALYQNLWYEQVTPTQCARLHRRIGERLAQGYGARAGEIAAELAMHFERGRDMGRAVSYRERAAENSIRRYAYREAISHATKGLDLLTYLPSAPERLRQELALQTVLAMSLVPMQGYTSPRVVEVYERARELGEQCGDPRRLFAVLVGLWQSATGRAEHKLAYDLGKRMVAIARQLRDPMSLLQARSALGATLFWLGRLNEAHEYLAKSFTHTDSQQDNSHIFTSWLDPGISGQAMAPLVLWHLGYADQALQSARQAVALALQLPDSFNRAMTCFLAGVLYHLQGSGPTQQEHVQTMIALCTEHGFPFFVALSTMLRGWMLVEQGHEDDGIAHMREGLTVCTAAGVGIFRPYYLGLLANALGKKGRTAEALDLVNEGLLVARRSKELVWQAELWRLKGELLLKSRVSAVS